MIQNDEFDSDQVFGSSPKLAVAERDVARAKAKLNAEIETASRAGRRLTTLLVRSARPAAIGVAVLTGVALAVALWRRRTSRMPSGPASRAPNASLGWELARAAVVALASSAGRHLAAKLVEQTDEVVVGPGRLAPPGALPPRP